MNRKSNFTTRIIAIALTLASLFCLQMGVIGLGGEAKEALDDMDNVKSEFVDLLDLGYLGLGNLDYLEEVLEEEDEDDLLDKLDNVADELDDCVDILLSGTYSMGDIKRICNLPDEMFSFMRAMAKMDDDMEERIDDTIADIKEENSYIALNGISTIITILTILFTVTAIYNMACYLLNRKKFTFLYLLLWILYALAATFVFVAGTSEDMLFSFQVGPILGLILAIAARRVWGKEYKALAAAGATMNQPLSNIVGAVKSAGKMPAAPQKAATATFCENCGTAIPADSKFCISCGTPVAK